ncbi:MAG: hypothetical protein GX093_04150 [Xanthomonadaceae bacterium]|nr:hypothetical protein [Xanthomonadaceae bacterium]
MTSKRKHPEQKRRPELEPYAPPDHPDVHVPEQQLPEEPPPKQREKRPQAKPS